MKNKKIIAIIGIFYTLIIISACIAIHYVKVNSALATQALTYEMKISSLKDSLTTELKHRKNAEQSYDSLQTIVKSLPDSASYHQMKGQLDTFKTVLQSQLQENINLVKKIRALSKQTIIKPQKDERDIIKDFLNGHSSIQPTTIPQTQIPTTTGQPEIHIHVHNYPANGITNESQHSEQRINDRTYTGQPAQGLPAYVNKSPSR